MKQIRTRILSIVMACAMLISLLPVTALAAGEGTTITVNESTSLATAFQQANGIAGTDPVTVVIPEGTYFPTENEQLKITRSNVIIQGAGMEETTIDCGSSSCSGQGAILVSADNVTLKDFAVTSKAGGGVAAIKVTDLNTEGDLVEGAVIENVKATAQGHGLNLHGVKDAQVKGCVAEGGKCGISLANAVGVTVSDTNASGIWGSIGMMYADNAAYANPVSLTIGAGNTFNNRIYSERTTANTPDSIDVKATWEGNGKILSSVPMKITTESGVDLGTITSAKISIGDVYYPTLEAALAAAHDGDTINLAAGTYELNNTLTINKSINLVGAGKNQTIIQATAEPATLIQVAGGNVNFSMSGIYVKGLENNTHNNSSALTVGSNDVPSKGTISITDCKFTDFTKNSITVKGGIVTISDNEIVCKGHPGAAGNGIQVDKGATATINNNQISGYESQSDKWSATGILALRDGKISALTGNTIENCQVALSVSALYNSADTAAIPSDLSGNTFTGCNTIVSYELDDEGNLVDILNNAQPGTNISLYGDYTLTSAATVKDGVSLFVSDGAPYYGTGSLNVGTGSLTVAQGGTLYVDKDTTLTGDVVNYGTVENYGTLTGSVTGNGTYIVATMVTTEEELRDAVDNYDGNPIVLGNNITLTSALDITKDGLVIDGDGHTITAENCAGIQIAADLNALTVKDLILVGKLPENTLANEGTGAHMGIGTYNGCYGVADLQLNNVTVDGFSYGLYFGKNPAGGSGPFNNNDVQITANDLEVKNCYIKGAYFEKLTDSTFTDCKFVDNGNDPNEVASNNNKDWMCGVDINLKNGSYENIKFIDCTFTGNGSNKGTALHIKARDDGNYGTNTELDGVTVTGCTFTNNNGSAPIVLGEPTANNKTPINVSIQPGVNYTNNLASDAAYTVTFVSDNAVVNTLLTKGEITLPTMSNKPGYWFAGWSANGTIYAANTKANITADTTFTAVWNVIDYGGGTTEPSGDYLVNVDRTTGGKVTVNPGRADKGDTVTITVKPNDGYVLDELTVTAKDGGSVKLTWKDDNKYTFTMPGSQVSIEATFVKDGQQPATGLPFVDVTTSDWYYDAVEYVYENDLMNGTSANAFSPFVTTSRAMILTILARYDGVDTSTGSTWYEAGAVWAIAEGVSDGTNLEANLTREQLVTMLWRYAGSPVVESDLSDYPDSASVSDWAVNAMIWAVENGVISGNGAGALNPQGTATRAEVAQILTNFCTNVA